MELSGQRHLMDIYLVTDHVQRDTKVFNGSLNSTEALSKLKQATNTWTAANENLPTTGDLQTLNQILDKVIDDIELNSTTVENVADSVFEVANNLLDESSTSSWKSLVNDLQKLGKWTVVNTLCFRPRPLKLKRPIKVWMI
ncbi:hypothetical protein MAR_000264 [Mya arenaria]|uniref:Uncharacterized protein n=1 Tax=Mya arenaria TaxID=6604 RepID=A0ABY7FCC7_MYAAR|nr:hypothetical protein MAR_000264 [Mya arenaria]